MASAGPALIDTDVLIWLTRGHARAAAAVAKLADWHVSAVTYMELVQGCRNKTELKTLQKTFLADSATLLPIESSISHRACTLVEQYALSHHLQMADALIAATALEHGLPLLTGNAKHFRTVPKLDLITFRP